MSATATRPVPRVMLTQGFAELTIEVRDLEVLERFYREVFGLQVLARFERGEGRREGAAALAGGDVRQDDPSS
jgi:catechol 2,3-dioxygenase-like lactoylglutathione lyase family enzyme